VWFVAWVLLVVLLLWFGRLSICLALRNLRLRGIGLRQVALIGAEAVVASLQARMASAGWSGYVVHQAVNDTQDMAQLEALANKPLDEIWVMLPLGDAQAIERTLHALRHSAASIRLVPDLLTLRLINHGVTEVMSVPMYDVFASPMTARTGS
jgi:putative colanic acid biosynthesis UDP-glucose lipid carrier transferase